MRRAAKVDANQQAIVQALRQAGCDVLSLAALGRGVPDLLVHAKRGGLLLVEVKTETGTLTPQQRAFRDQWPVRVIRSVDEALRLVGMSENRPKSTL